MQHHPYTLERLMVERHQQLQNEAAKHRKLAEARRGQRGARSGHTSIAVRVIAGFRSLTRFGWLRRSRGTPQPSGDQAPIAPKRGASNWSYRSAPREHGGRA